MITREYDESVVFIPYGISINDIVHYDYYWKLSFNSVRFIWSDAFYNGDLEGFGLVEFMDMMKYDKPEKRTWYNTPSRARSHRQSYLRLKGELPPVEYFTLEEAIKKAGI